MGEGKENDPYLREYRDDDTNTKILGKMDEKMQARYKRGLLRADTDKTLDTMEIVRQKETERKKESEKQGRKERLETPEQIANNKIREDAGLPKVEYDNTEPIAVE
jgi:hypothetical protein